MYPFLYYAIITGSRTGSSYLCDLIHSTNRAGKPDEYFNKDMIPYYEQHILPQTEQSYIDKIIWHTKKANFVVGVKLNHKDHVELAREHGFLNKITHWIWLRRRDKVLQAISRYKAWKTNVWDAVEKEKKPMPPVPYSTDGIRGAWLDIIAEEQWIEDFFKGKDYLEIYYEDDVLAHPEQTVISILDYLRISTDDLPTIHSDMQRTTTNEHHEWKQRFLKEM